MADPYIPRWEGVFEAWSKKYVGANAWRVSHILDYDEALQECAAQFAYVADYARRNGIDNNAWFMSIFQRSVTQRFNDLANKDTKTREGAIAYAQEQRFSHGKQHGVPVVFQEGPLLALLSSASQELKDVLAVIASAPSEFLALALNPDKDKRWSRKLCRLTQAKGGINKERDDLIAELRNLLAGES